MLSSEIIIVCSRLDLPGGIERSITKLANLFCSNFYNVTILILDKTSQSFYPLHDLVKVVQITADLGITEKGNVLTRKASFIKDIYNLRKLLKKGSPKYIITTEYSITIAVWLSCIGLNKKIITREAFHFNYIKRNKFWTVLFKIVYPRLDCVICLNKKEAVYFKSLGCKTAVIPNYIENKIAIEYPIHSKKLLTVGWLTKTKGSDFISSIAEKVLNKYDDWIWTIIGDGPEYEKLDHSLIKANLKDKVFIIKPYTSDITQIYKSTSIYILTSRFEAFPNAILEAMSFGIPSVAFNCPTGPSDIIHNGKDGILVDPEDINAMADAVCNLIANNEERKKMGENAFKNVRRFSPERILKQWKNRFNDL